MLTLKYFVLLLVASSASQLNRTKLRTKQFVTLHKWTDFDMTFPTPDHLKWALQKGYYDRSKPLPVDMDVEYGDDGFYRTFVTVPRLGVGVPYSLAIILDSDHSTVLNPKLEPYPSYDWHSSHGANCSGITSAIRTFIDSCWRLWVIDSGQINSLQYCSPQILAFDLVTDTLVHRYTLSEELYTAGVSVFTALAVASFGDEGTVECPHTMVYIADPWGYGLIVYDTSARKAWRIEHELMRPDKKLQKFNSAYDGIFTVSISPNRAAEERHLYFHALNSYKEVSMPLSIVNNASIWCGDNPPTDELVVVVGNRGTQCESEAIDSAGNLYCSLMSSSALISWKQGSDYNADNLQVVAYSPEQLKFVTGLKINKNAAAEDEIWALSNDPKLFVGGIVKPGDVKFQIIGCRANDLLRNERCTVGAVAKHNSIGSQP